MTSAISICICTYLRPKPLEHLLSALRDVRLPAVAIDVIVVDNDVEQSAHSVVERIRTSGFPLPITYAVEPVRSVAAARNRCVSTARGTVVAFVDDDEVPDSGWLFGLHETLHRHGAGAVFGPVLPRLPEDAPPWIVRGGFFDRPRHPTGTKVRYVEARTGNVLVRRHLLESREGPFDPQFGQSGGEDTELFGFLERKGAQFIWCDEAIVYEDVSVNRCTREWILRRSMRAGESYVRLRAKLDGPWSVPWLVLQGFAYVVVAPVIAVLLLPCGLDRSMRWLRRAFTGVGRILAVTPTRSTGISA